MGYAANTSVSADASIQEIERIVTRWDADEFGYGRKKAADGQPGMGMVFFRLHDRQVRFTVPLPDQNDPEFTLTDAKRQRRSESAAYNAWDQKVRSRWRSLALVIKAKLVAVDEGVVTFEQEFGMHFVLPGGSTVYEQVAPQIEAAYESGVPGMLQIGSK